MFSIVGPSQGGFKPTTRLSSVYWIEVGKRENTHNRLGKQHYPHPASVTLPERMVNKENNLPTLRNEFPNLRWYFGKDKAHP